MLNSVSDCRAAGTVNLKLHPTAFMEICTFQTVSVSVLKTGHEGGKIFHCCIKQHTLFLTSEIVRQK